MRIELVGWEGANTSLRLPVDGDGPAKHVHAHRLSGLSGVLEQADGVVQLSDVAATEIDLGAAHWVFGTVALSSLQPCALRHAALQMRAGGGQPIAMDLEAGSVHFERLQVEVGQVSVVGAARLQGASLRLAEGRGTLRASKATLSELRVQIGGLSLGAPSLEVEALSIGWGEPEGFHLSARTAAGPWLHLESERARVSAREPRLSGFEVRDAGAIHMLALELESLEAKVDLSASESSEPARAPAAPTRPVVDLDLLDALVGRIEADARIDVRLPAGLRRKLRIPLRLDVVEGAIDYRVLEHSLPRLEDSLLDFSRDGEWLVLEFGLPLLPTRGFGKQLLRWPLAGRYGTTREGHWLRLAALPRFERPGQAGGKERESTSPSGGKGAVQLERTEVAVGPVRLKLPPPSQHMNAALQLLCFEDAEIEGELNMLPDERPPGRLRATLRALEARIDSLPVGQKELDLAVHIAHVPELQLQTQGVRPAELVLTTGAARLKGIRFE